MSTSSEVASASKPTSPARGATPAPPTALSSRAARIPATAVPWSSCAATQGQRPGVAAVAVPVAVARALDGVGAQVRVDDLDRVVDHRDPHAVAAGRSPGLARAKVLAGRAAGLPGVPQVPLRVDQRIGPASCGEPVSE
jgi:hypothetical protein